jgi:hypothetical protein
MRGARERSSPVAEVAPAPQRFVDEEFGVAGPELRVLGDRERSAECVGVRHRVIRLDARCDEDAVHVRELGGDHITKVSNRLDGAVAVGTSTHVVDLTEVDPRHERALLGGQLLDVRCRIDTVQVPQDGSRAENDRHVPPSGRRLLIAHYVDGIPAPELAEHLGDNGYGDRVGARSGASVVPKAVRRTEGAEAPMNDDDDRRLLSSVDGVDDDVPSDSPTNSGTTSAAPSSEDDLTRDHFGTKPSISSTGPRIGRTGDRCSLGRGSAARQLRPCWSRA